MNTTQQMQLTHTSLDTEFETLSLLATTRNVVEFLHGPARHPSSSAEIAASKSTPHGPASGINKSGAASGSERGTECTGAPGMRESTGSELVTAAAPLVLDTTAAWRPGEDQPSGDSELVVTATALGQGRAFAGTVTFSELPRKLELMNASTSVSHLAQRKNPGSISTEAGWPHSAQRAKGALI
jgi:hypothetical protein